MKQRSDDERPGPCSGIRVLDLTKMVSGPICTQYLGDLGADVLKVEPPGRGDTSRVASMPYPDGMTGQFLQLNRNKRSIALDLRSEEGLAVARRLAARSDVVVENFRPGVAERLGVDYETLAADNPGLVYVAITGFGPDGPYADHPAYDHVIQGLAGFMPVQGETTEPAMIQCVAVDKLSGLLAGSAVLAALLERERSGGRGQRIDVPMLDAFASFIHVESLSPRSYVDEPPLPSPASRMFRAWPTRDGFLAGIAVEDAQFAGLCRAIGREDLLDDERFATTGARFGHIAELYPILEGELRQWETDEIVERLRREGAPFAPVHDVEAFLADPQVAHNGTVFEAPGPTGQATRYLTHPARFERTPARFRLPPPRLGEHTDESLLEAGFSQPEIDALRARGIVA